MYITVEGDVLTDKDVEKYNSDKFAFSILRSYPYKLTHVNQFLDLDIAIKNFNEWLKLKNWEIRSRVSLSGCELMYCIVGDRDKIINYDFTIPLPWKEILPIDYKYFKEPNYRDDIPDEILFYNESTDNESDWKNRLIRCKYVRNWDNKLIDEFDKFCESIDGMTIEKHRPYIKAEFREQIIKEQVFKKMSVQYEHNGININYFRRELNWYNVPLSEYERFTKIKY